MNTNKNVTVEKKYFGVKHYYVKIVKERINPIRFIINVISYAVFMWLILIGITLLVYIADIKIRNAKGDFTPPKYNAYVVLTGSMLPEIEPNDVVLTKKKEGKDLKTGDIITFVPSDSRISNIIVTLAKFEGLREEEPLKITSVILLDPRKDLILCSPSTHLTASTILLLPLPLGPTIPVKVGSSSIVILSAKLLNPCIIISLMYILSPSTIHS